MKTGEIKALKVGDIVSHLSGDHQRRVVEIIDGGGERIFSVEGLDSKNRQQRTLIRESSLKNYVLQSQSPNPGLLKNLQERVKALEDESKDTKARFAACQKELDAQLDKIDEICDGLGIQRVRRP